jgi:hypothetical protein
VPRRQDAAAALPSGRAGLDAAAAKGLLRAATLMDAQAWLAAVAAGSPSGQTTRTVPEPAMFGAYVVLKPFTFPAGLFGAHSATFFIPPGIPMPAGDPGHSTVFDFNTLRCQGPFCS